MGYSDSSQKIEMQFNMALAMLQRIDSLLNACSQLSFRRDFCSWGHILFTLSREVDYLFDKDETEKNNYFQEKIYPLASLFEQKMFFNPELEKFVLRRNAIFPEYSILWGYLTKYEKFLKSAMHNRGMLSIAKPNINMAIAQM